MAGTRKGVYKSACVVPDGVGEWTPPAVSRKSQPLPLVFCLLAKLVAKSWHPASRSLSVGSDYTHVQHKFGQLTANELVTQT